MSVDVLHVISGLDVGGAERSLANLLLGGLSNATRHGVVSLQDRGTYGESVESAGVPLWCVNMARGRPSPGALLQLRRIVANARPKLLQGWMYHGNLAVALTRAAVSPRPLLAWNIRQTLESLRHEKPLTRWVIRAHRPLAKHVDAIVYNCAASQRQHEGLGLRARHSEVIANGVDTERFRPSAERGAALRAQLGIPETAPVVGHAARHHPMKDHAAMLAAAAKVTLTLPDAHFVLAGLGVSGQNPALRKLSTRLPTSRVHLLGERDDMPDFFAALDVFCCSSAWGEGFPNVLVEAMACGVPCVTTELGASAEIVESAGLVVPPGDPAALARALLQILQLPADEKHKLDARARQRVLNDYAIANTVSCYRALYARLLES